MWLTKYNRYNYVLINRHFNYGWKAFLWKVYMAVI